MRYQRPRLWGVVLAMAIVTAGSGGLAGPVSAAAFHFNPFPWVGAALDVANMFGAGPALESVVGSNSIAKGSDGRLTVLLLGSDYRASTAGTGERTDSIIFMTIDNASRISAISLPRDVGNVPIAPGVIFKPKINGLFKHFKQIDGSRPAALEDMRKAFQYAFQIQIDYVAFVRFTSLVRMVDAVGGVQVNLPKTLYDNRIQDARGAPQIGAKFLAGSWLEKGSNAAICTTVGKPINWTASPNCTFALLYVRSRHGPGNNDWVRAKRQQKFIFDAMQQTTSNQAQHSVLSAASGDDFYTTLPLNVSTAEFIYNTVHYATFPNSKVLKPPTYASNVKGTQKQQLKLTVVRALFHSWFGPLN